MPKVNPKNERTKRSFYRYLKHSRSYFNTTVDNHETALSVWDDFTDHEDYAAFNSEKVIEFKDWLIEGRGRKRSISLSTLRAYLRCLRKFFRWLSNEKGYKSRINLNDVDFLKIGHKEERMAKQTGPRSYPPQSYIRKLVRSIEPRTEIDLRDRALISFAFLTGMRDQAIATLPLGCFSRTTMTINQDPRKGVQTKYSKHIPSVLFPFDQEMVKFVLDWAKHLEERGFGTEDPLFPRSQADQGPDRSSFETATVVEPVKWHGAGPIREIFKKRSQMAGLTYFQPHTFRHLAIAKALEAGRTLEHLKAISQNFGHEHVATTLGSYANYPAEKLVAVIKSMDFQSAPEDEAYEIKP